MKILNSRFLIFIISSFASIFPANAQDKFSYYQLINKAEISIVDSAYADALKAYELAFKEKESSFAKDLYNAAICAIKLNKYGEADKYLHQVGLLGFIIDSLENRVAFKDYVKSRNYVSLKNQLEKPICNLPYNVAYRASLLQLTADDQCSGGEIREIITNMNILALSV